MLKFGLIPALAVTLTCLQIAPAVARDGGADYAYLNDSGMLVDSQGEMDNEDDVVSVAEPAAHYVARTDTIVTPYGYRPYYQNGYYQGYDYNPQYAYNPYYAAAAYSPVDPVSTAVISTVLNVAQGGRVDGRELVQALIGGLVASQLQQQYPAQYGDYPGYPSQYAQPQYYPPQYAQPQYYPVQYAQPQYYAPQPYEYVRQSMPRGYERHHDEHGGRQQQDGNHDEGGD